MNYKKLIELTKAGVEIWKTISGYEGYYEISNFGRIKSVERWVKQGPSTRHVKERYKSIHIGAYGYLSVTLCKDGKSRSIPIHRLLAKAFIPNPKGKTAIDHINTDKTDNRLENLRWVTPKENSNNILTLEHCKENTYSKETSKKRLETRKKRGTSTAPKTIYQYTKEGIFIKKFYSIKEAERNTSINHNSIHRVLNDPTQSAGGFLWTSTYVKNIIYNKRKRPNSKAILQYDAKGGFVKEWKSVTEAAKNLNLNVGNIIRNIKSNATPRKYKFVYKEKI